MATNLPTAFLAMKRALLALLLVSSLWLVAADEALLGPLGNAPVPSGATLPQWPRIIGPNSDRNTLSIRSKDLELAHSPECLGSFVVRITGKPFALGQSHPL